MNKILEYYNFGNDIHKWIKLFRHNICSLINQGGNFSEKENVHRGCRKGDPIALENNNLIMGIKVYDQEIVLSHFADDTTMYYYPGGH